MRFLVAAGITVAVAISGTSPVLAAGNVEAGRTKAAACMACHGPDGNSLVAAWPKLAGQLPLYIEKQLHDFKTGRRKNDQMSPMAQPLSDQDIEDLAAFFSAQPVSQGASANQDRLAAGKQLYFEGKGRPEVVPACTGCHGPAGGGKADWAATMTLPPTTLAPAIGSQHAAYVAAQLQAYRTKTRDNDLAHVMRDVAGRLTDDDISAVAEYVATLSR